MEKSVESITEPEKKPLTQEEKIALAKELMARDEETTFALAGIALQAYTGGLLKNQNQVVNAFVKMGMVIRSNPGFTERFRKAHAAVVAMAQDMKPSGKANSPGTSPQASSKT